MKQITWVLFGWLALITITQAASFDCGKAAMKIEKLICEHEELSKLDEDLNKTYLKSLERSDVKQQAIKSQRQWLKERRNTCQSVECLRNAYETRIKEVGLMASSGIVIMNAPDNKGASPVPPSKAPELKEARVPIEAAKNKAEQSWEWVEEDTRPDAVLKNVAQKELLIGDWDGADNYSAYTYGTLKIGINHISWGKCKVQYSIVLNTVGETYPDKLGFEDTRDERFVTLKLKLEPKACDKNLGFLQFSISPNNPEIAKVIEYGVDNKPNGWLNFSKR